MDHATIPRNSSNFCNDITSHTKPAALTIPDLMRFVVRMLRVAKKLMDKAEREGKLWIPGLYEYRVTPQSGTTIRHTQRKRSMPTTKHLRSPRNVSNLTGTHEEARDQARKELH